MTKHTFFSTGLDPGSGTASALAAALGKLLVIQSSRWTLLAAAAAAAVEAEAAAADKSASVVAAGACDGLAASLSDPESAIQHAVHSSIWCRKC